jgi:hypothetical protein
MAEIRLFPWSLPPHMHHVGILAPAESGSTNLAVMISNLMEYDALVALVDTEQSESSWKQLGVGVFTHRMTDEASWVHMASKLQQMNRQLRILIINDSLFSPECPAMEHVYEMAHRTITIMKPQSLSLHVADNYPTVMSTRKIHWLVSSWWHFDIYPVGVYGIDMHLSPHDVGALAQKLRSRRSHTFFNAKDSGQLLYCCPEWQKKLSLPIPMQRWISDQIKA